MKFLLFFIVAIFIAGNNAQKTAIGTDYLRAHANESFSSNSARYIYKPINADIVDLPPPIVIAADDATPITTSISSTTSTTSTTEDDESHEHGANHDHSHESHHKHDHSHESHHKHDAKITVDLHNLVDLLTQEIHTSEERLLAAIQHQNEAKTVAVLKSYRTADR